MILKKELIGNFKNPGKSYEPKEKPIEVFIQDFVQNTSESTLLKNAVKLQHMAFMATQKMLVFNVGISVDTAALTVNGIRGG